MRRKLEGILKSLNYHPDTNHNVSYYDVQELTEIIIGIVSWEVQTKMEEAFDNYDLGATRVFDETPYETVLEDFFEVLMLEVETM